MSGCNFDILFIGTVWIYFILRRMDMELVLEQGRPQDETGRLEKEIRTYDLLDSLGIEYERVDHEEANTMEACAAVDEVLAPAVICKNLFLCNTQKTKFYLLMIKNDKKFKTKEIEKLAEEVGKRID